MWLLFFVSIHIFRGAAAPHLFGILGGRGNGAFGWVGVRKIVLRDITLKVEHAHLVYWSHPNNIFMWFQWCKVLAYDDIFCKSQKKNDEAGETYITSCEEVFTGAFTHGQGLAILIAAWEIHPTEEILESRSTVFVLSETRIDFTRQAVLVMFWGDQGGK